MNFFSNIFAAFIIIAYSTATDAMDETNTISLEQTESSLRGGGNIHRRCRKLAEEGRKLEGRQWGPCSYTVYSTCNQCPSDENERCEFIGNTYTGSETFQGCVCKSAYTIVNFHCAGGSGSSCIDDVYCVSGSCVDDVCVDPGYSVVGEETKCGLVNNGKRLAWNAVTTAACAQMVAGDSECSNIFMVKNRNQAIGGDDNLEHCANCVCVTNGQSCSMQDAPDWNTFSLN